MIIYLDMDDVVADWHAAAQEFLKMRWDVHGQRIPKEDWDKLKQHARFYRHLPLKEGAHELVQFCRDLVSNGHAEGLAFLSAIPKDNDMQWAPQDKVWWAHEHFEGVPVFLGPYSHEKYMHCEPGDILIDDRHTNCEEWINAGGQAHIYRQWPECKAWLESIFKL